MSLHTIQRNIFRQTNRNFGRLANSHLAQVESNPTIRGELLSNPLTPLPTSTFYVSTILSRAPILMKKPPHFESAYYAYHRELYSQLTTPFPVDFYFKKGSLAEQRWLAEEEARKEGIDSKTPSLGGPDEVTTKDRLAYEDTEIAQSTIAHSDEASTFNYDTRRLDRLMSDSLYLIVKLKHGSQGWEFPTGSVEGGSPLHVAAENSFRRACGTNIDVWYVGRKPIGVKKEKEDSSRVRNPSNTADRRYFS